MGISQQFGWWTVIDPAIQDRRTNQKVLCRCRCGNEKYVYLGNLRSGKSKSCGCFRDERVRATNSTHGWSRTKLHRCWTGILTRCDNPKNSHYHRYGGRGITVCPEWRDFRTFMTWALSHGYEEDLTIERIDNDGPYSPDNCRWATWQENRRNKSGAILITAWGETKHLAAWAEDARCSVTYLVLRGRIRLGWEPERAITTPLMSQGRKPCR